MKGKIFPICPVCSQEVMSDARSAGYCRLCGMSTGGGRQFCHGCEEMLEAQE